MEDRVERGVSRGGSNFKPIRLRIVYVAFCGNFLLGQLHKFMLALQGLGIKAQRGSADDDDVDDLSEYAQWWMKG